MEREQNINAPISKYAAFAYTAALNYLLADRRHVKQIGDTTIVYWAEDADTQSQDVFSALLDGGDDTISDKDLNDIMRAVSVGNRSNGGTAGQAGKQILCAGTRAERGKAFNPFFSYRIHWGI
jgi:hypothetical protein